MGNCWFVDSFADAQTPDEEIALIGYADLANVAVIGKDFKDAVSTLPGHGGESTNDSGNVISSEVETSPAIALTHYAPNELRYTFSTDSDRAAIFSEIYYPKGWKAWIEPKGSYGQVKNGQYRPTAEAQPLELFRADWILRGAVIPAGEGDIVMRFEPDSYQKSATISRICSIALLLMLLLAIGGMAALSLNHSNKNN